jgi:hypothetical protein
MGELKNQLIVLVGGIIIWLFDKWWKRYTQAQESKKKESTSEMEIYLEVDKLVREAETKIMRKNPRIMKMHVMHLSNGTFTESGLPLLNITFLHEEVFPTWAVEPFSDLFQRRAMPSMFLKPANEVREKGKYYLKRRSTLDLTDKNEKDLHDFLITYKPEVKSMLWLPLLNKSGKPVAIWCMYFPAEEAVDDTDIMRLSLDKVAIEDIYYQKLKKNGK